MAVEPKRGCGYRKVGALYIVGGELMAPCDRLAFELTVCPACSAGIKQTRGWTWIQPTKILGGNHNGQLGCHCDPFCAVCNPQAYFGSEGKAGLLWVGESFYPTPVEFIKEGYAQGISRRISQIPHDFIVGITTVFFAHPKAIDNTAGVLDQGDIFKPGIISAFRPQAIERIVLQSQYDLLGEAIEAHEVEMNRRGCEINFESFTRNNRPSGEWEAISRLYRDQSRSITLVPVPDDDPDHK